jgi:hypothetical protein
MPTSKLVKSGVFILLLIAASCYLGYVCNQFGQSGDAILSSSLDILSIFLQLLLALALVAIAAGLVAALVRPLWLGFIAFALASLAVFFIWGLSLIALGLAVLYFLAGLVYILGVKKGLDERIKFSVRPVQDNQLILLLALVIAACALFYTGYAAQIEREGFTIPTFVVDMAMDMAEGQVENVPGLTPQEREQALAEVRQGIEREIKNWVEPFEPLIPAVVAFIILGMLVTVVGLMNWLPVVALAGIFALLAASHVTRKVTEEREVERVVLD